MTRSAKSIFDRALKLPPTERARLIEELYNSLGQPKEHRRAWATEAEDRIDAYDAGILKASPAVSVPKLINRR